MGPLLGALGVSACVYALGMHLAVMVREGRCLDDPGEANDASSVAEYVRRNPHERAMLASQESVHAWIRARIGSVKPGPSASETGSAPSRAHGVELYRVDPALVPMIEALRKEPERAVAVKGYPYRVAFLRPGQYFNAVDIKALRGLWEHLSTGVGWDWRDNHSVFLFEFEGRRHAVQFSDLTARFGREEDVSLARD